MCNSECVAVLSADSRISTADSRARWVNASGKLEICRKESRKVVPKAVRPFDKFLRAMEALRRMWTWLSGERYGTGVSIMDEIVWALVPPQPPAASVEAALVLPDGNVVPHRSRATLKEEGAKHLSQSISKLHDKLLRDGMTDLAKYAKFHTKVIQRAREEEAMAQRIRNMEAAKRELKESLTREVTALQKGPERQDGDGTALFASGNRYEGQWGCEGEWVDGKLVDGRGTYRYAEGGVYHGEWRDDKRHGEGAVTPVSAKDNVVEYEGDGVNGKMHGKGNEVPVTATPKAESQQGREAEAMVTYIQRIEAAKSELEESLAREAMVLQQEDQTAASATNSTATQPLPTPITTTWPDPATTSAMWLATRQDLEAIEAAHRVAVKGSVFVMVKLIDGPAGMGKDARQQWLATRPIKLNDEMTYSVSPEAIALHQAASCSQLYPKGTVVDMFAGAGGDTIAMLREGMSVYSIDKEAEHVEILEYNTQLYGVQPVIALPEDYESVVDRWDNYDFKADLAIIDPPWGGRQYLNQKTYDLAHMADGSLSMFDVVRVAATVTTSFVTKIPKNTSILSCAQLGLWVEQLRVRAEGSDRPPTSFTPPIVEVFVTREKGRGRSGNEVITKPKYAAVYLGDIARGKLKELKRAGQGPPPKVAVTTPTTLEDHVMGPMWRQSSLLHQVDVSVVPHKKCWHGL
ncbi:unnamed protein product [Vitrella brassicaformis CCMP3155]|uniref:Trimethylguanosine synthase n=1 Tax=Vitrella brassicaformis (strain CCMP3155) TaxID=1169540 RepID=A0A0G4FFP2_VITBC|nr:unnamed protein product [Vitrella brassicaformis CCMP3155]|eukprot:CEM12001.1 unnamed protein product [Vitrella brassicaformis CCMP3155]